MAAIELPSKGVILVPNAISLEQMTALATQLSPQDQLKLVAQISGQLITGLAAVTEQESNSKTAGKEQLRLAEELLAEVEDIEDDSLGEFDAAKTIQQLRDERMAEICLSGASMPASRSSGC